MFTPSKNLTDRQTTAGLNLVIKDGLAAEAMTTFTGGAFLVAMAVLMGASNFQIGLLAALPTITNIFQLVAVWLVQKYNNRRAVAVVFSLFARLPLLVIGSLPFLFTGGTTLKALMFLLFFHYLFGSIAGASWNSWMKDLIPEKILGSYFSQRSRLTQILNVTLSLVLALFLDYIKSHYPSTELLTYSVMFIIGGAAGLAGIYMLSRTPEPQSYLATENIFRLLGKPFKDKNFRKLLVFNSAWTFALNLATPFFSVYMMKTMGLHLSYIIGLTILSQLSSIFSVKLWGKFADQFSNKTIIAICGPLYILTILAWMFTGVTTANTFNLIMLVIINIVSGMSTAGVNLALNNIGIKLAKKEHAIAYISAKNMLVALFSAIAPLSGGWMADFLFQHNITWNIQWKNGAGNTVHLLSLHNWNFLFLLGGILAMCTLPLLTKVDEHGEAEKSEVIHAIVMRLKIFSRPQLIPLLIRRRMHQWRMRR